jgi:hypothetical protein
MIIMTGSNLAAIVIPIVVMFSLGAWIVMVFHADSHPVWRDRTAAAPNKALTPRGQQVSPHLPHRPYPAGTVQRGPVRVAHR